MRDEGEDGEVEQSGKPEAPAEQPGESPAASDLPDQPGQLHVPVRGRLDRTIAGRPLIVYLVLFAAAATLLLLLLIVWLEGRPGPNPPQFCTSITAGEAQQAIFAGNVERMIVLVDEEDPLSTLTGIRLEMTDDTCREPHQGADFRNDLYLIIGAAEFYNTFGDQRVSISYQRQDIPIALLSTSTPIPTATLLPTETPTASATPEVRPTETLTSSPEPATPSPQSTETVTATPTMTATAAATRTLEALELPASPVGSPEASPSRTATVRAAVTPTPR